MWQKDNDRWNRNRSDELIAFTSNLHLGNAEYHINDLFRTQVK
jgi:hypothetical protein